MADRKPKTQEAPTEVPKRKEPAHVRWSRLAKALARRLPSPYTEQVSEIAQKIASQEIKLNPTPAKTSLIGQTVKTPYGEGKIVRAIQGFYEVHLFDPPAQGPKVVFLSRKIQKAS
jgi:hypothetical protein